MTKQNGTDETTQLSADQTSNELTAEKVSGMIVQAGTITGGIHQHMTAPQVPIPRQLLAAPRVFVGRANELALLALDPESSANGERAMAILALAGAGGMGKTALALHWAHQNRDRFVDGQLFVDLRGFSPVSAPMEPAAAVRGFLDAFGVDPNRIPADPDAQASMYRSLLVGKRMLIMLDNAVDAAQIDHLLPGEALCTVMVTSRHFLLGLITRYGARHVKLGVLTEADSRHLLSLRLGTDRVAAEPTAVERLLECCEGFALALDIVAGRAQLSPDIPLEELAAELEEDATHFDAFDDDDPAASLPAVLSWSLRALTAEQVQAFGLLGVAPGPDISLPAAACLTGLPLRKAREVLRNLEHASLLDRDVKGRYRMHDLIRGYATETAQEQIPDDRRDAALRRVVNFYAHTAYTADRILNPHREPLQGELPTSGCEPPKLPDYAAALGWFDAEHACLLAAQQTAAIRQWNVTAWHLAWALTTFHHRRGYLRDYLVAWQTGLSAAERLSDQITQVRAHRNLGRAHASLQRHDEAIEHLRRSLELARQHNDVANQAHTYRMLSWACERHGDDRLALEHVTEALRLYRSIDHSVGTADALNAVGTLSARLGDFDTAREHCEAALVLHRGHNDVNGEAYTLDSLGYVDHHTGQYEQALDHYQQALALRRDLGNTYQVANVLDGLGHPYAALGRHDEARATWQEALEFYQQQGRDTDAARVEQQLNGLDSTKS